MDRAMRDRDIPYREKLNVDAKARYLEKTTELGGFDPYEHTEWDTLTVTEDYDQLPPLTEVSIYQYLVCEMRFCTLEDFNNRRSMDCHNRFTVGWVGHLQMYMVNAEYIVIRTEVLHSQKDLSRQKDKLMPWVSITIGSGRIGAAHCDCMAGLGESCSHVAALLFKIAHLVKITNRTCTDVAAYCKVPSNADVEGGKGWQIDFTTAAEKKRALDKCISGESDTVAGKRTRRGHPQVSGRPQSFDHREHLFRVHMQSLGSIGVASMTGYHQTYGHPTKPSLSCPTLSNPQARGKRAQQIKNPTTTNAAQVNRQDTSVVNQIKATRGGRTVKPPSRFED